MVRWSIVWKVGVALALGGAATFATLAQPPPLDAIATSERHDEPSDETTTVSFTMKPDVVVPMWQFVRAYRHALGLPAGDELRDGSSSDDEHGNLIRTYQQFHDGKPVNGGTLRLLVRTRSPLTPVISGHALFSLVKQSARPSLTEQQAKERARVELEARGVRALTWMESELRFERSAASKYPRLTYEVEVGSAAPRAGRWTVWLDAVTGDLVYLRDEALGED